MRESLSLAACSFSVTFVIGIPSYDQNKHASSKGYKPSSAVFVTKMSPVFTFGGQRIVLFLEYNKKCVIYSKF